MVLAVGETGSSIAEIILRAHIPIPSAQHAQRNSILKSLERNREVSVFDTGKSWAGREMNFPLKELMRFLLPLKPPYFYHLPVFFTAPLHKKK
jgi:hypothetical protein